ncbi:unnamed protein product [Parascedosporium putredinis]|uniref:Uncharacterized protein n=1 Tax=Parascedosporium putredinis TaxID=1442378 RepID=A0A9P1HC91_9PEZI|nr:unnamed protein product [Parascedosporium putredinis]CAI8003539.1 unnamed protein product [Parascedosporium putredinis]
MTADLAGQVGGLETRFQSVTLEKPGIKESNDQDSPVVDDVPPKVTPAVDSLAEKTSTGTDESGPIRYRIEYVGKDSGTFSIQGRTATLDALEEPPVFEYVEVRLSSQKELTSATKAEDIKKTDKGKGRAYINIFSPAVAEALRCVVDYFPKLDLSGNVIKILEPYSVFVFYEKEFTAYRERAAKLAATGTRRARTDGPQGT